MRTAYVYCSTTDQTFIIYMQTERKIFSSVKAFPSHLLLLLLLPADGPHCVHNTVRLPAATAVDRRKTDKLRRYANTVLLFSSPIFKSKRLAGLKYEIPTPRTQMFWPFPFMRRICKRSINF